MFKNILQEKKKGKGEQKKMTLELKRQTGTTTTKEGGNFKKFLKDLEETTGENLKTFGDLLKFKKLLEIKIFLKDF